MNPTKQYEISGNTLTLKVKRSPLIIRGILFFFTLITFVAPISSVLSNLSFGYEIKLLHFISILVFGLMGYYLLRVSLWNSYGQEKIVFGKNQIDFCADYRWFKGKEIAHEIANQLEFGIQQIGYEDDNLGTLKILGVEPPLVCVTKMPKSQLEDLIADLALLKMNN